ncbi:MAG: hypothetical protein IT350_09185 [Deltaproteobacteria bacterium]|nr:hypothetical protein [Deltaproteobacteria bacterium]
MTNPWKTLGSTALMALLLAVAVVLMYPGLVDFDRRVPASDDEAVVAWLDASLFDQTLRSSWLRVGGFPAYYAEVEGGLAVGSHPRDGAASPITLALLRLDAIDAVKIKTLLAIWAGAMGAYLMGRRMGAGRAASFTAALLLPASGFVRDAIHADPLSLQALFALPALPIVLYAPANPATILLCALAVVLSSFQTGSLVAFAPLALVLAGLARALREPDRRRTGITFALLIAVHALLIGAIRWLPGVEFWDAREIGHAIQSITVAPVSLAMRAWRLADALAPAGAVSLAAILALTALGFAKDRASRFLIVLGAALLAYALVPAAEPGDTMASQIWWVIRPFSNPASAAPIWALAILSGVCAIALHAFFIATRSRAAHLVPIAAAAALGASTMHAAPPQRDVPLLRPDPLLIGPVREAKPFFTVRTRFFTNELDRPIDLHPTLIVEDGLAARNAVEPFRGQRRTSHRVHVQAGQFKLRRNSQDRGEAWFPYRNGDVRSVVETPAGLEIHVVTRKERTTLVVNRNFDDDWSVLIESAETPPPPEPEIPEEIFEQPPESVPPLALPEPRVFPTRGLVSTRLDHAGEQVVTLTYAGSMWRYGMGLSCVSLVLALASAVGFLARREDA